MTKKIQTGIPFELFEKAVDFPEEDQKLIQHAQEACELAYAPYSGFWVGAALLLADGQVIKGANQENAAYPSGLCAERVAIFSHAASQPTIKVDKIVVTARKSENSIYLPAPPCGACRQVMLELENRQGVPIQVIFQATDGQWIKAPSASTLLPFCFEQVNLL